MKRDTRKIIMAVLLNLFLGAVLLYVLDMTGAMTFESIMTSLGLSEGEAIKIEDRFLLEREELNKQWLVLSLKEKDYGEKLHQLTTNDQRLKDKENQLKGLEKQLREREKKASEAEMEKIKRSERVRIVADQLMNMPPKDAVPRLEAQTDDLLVIDILRAMDAVAADQGKRSIVPYLLSLMKGERAAAIQRKMANISTLSNEPEF
ncbi:MAG TPA: hypothetical protein PLD82_06545 [Spirochaetota bacterium]|nr:hypothetical protein [Spirochaetota bacterium]HPH03942.1 hypothetical protein [Spirochaetota bacterium]